jgi:hypothetical protein
MSMSRKTDLERLVGVSSEVIRECGKIIQTSDRPREILRNRNTIAEHKAMVEEYLREYWSLLSVPEEILAIAASLLSSRETEDVQERKRQEYERLFGSPGTACIVFPVHRDSKTGQRPLIHWLVRVEVAMAFVRLRSLLEQLGWRIDVKHSEERKVLGEKGSKSVTFFLGSTRATTVSIDLFPELGSEFSFGNDPARLVERRKAKDGNDREIEVTLAEYLSPMDQGENADHGLIIKASKPDCPDYSVFWLAGIHAVGTWGATEFLCSEEGLKEILDHVGSKDFTTVVETRFRDPLRLLRVDVKMTPRPFLGGRGGG